MNRELMVLIIMDGYGVAPPSDTNAVTVAETPNVDALMAKYPNTTIKCAGSDVGLPDGQMGNSEVGHLNLGAGRIIYQPLTRITKSIEDGDFFDNPALVSAMENAVENDSSLHLMGLVSDGGVHSHIDHALAAIKMAKKYKIEKIYMHCYMDGRDVPPSSGKCFIEELEGNLKEIGAGEIASVHGRFWAMDRDNIWERVQKSYDALTLGEGETTPTATDAMQQSYDKDETDEFVKPTVVTKDGKPVATIKENDSVIFFNFRPDRARQLTNAFISEDFKGFDRKSGYLNLCFTTLTPYDVTFKNVNVGYRPLEYKNTLGEYFGNNNIAQLRIAETQKYAHVTYFFNGGVEKPNNLEDRLLIDSPRIATFDLKPSMSAVEVTDAVVAQIEAQKYDAIIINFANCDMVGHTGIMKAAVEAVETVDTCVGRVVAAAQKIGGKLLITADHGNAERMWDFEENVPYTAHTVKSPVPFIVVDDDYIGKPIRDDGKLADVAPTMLKFMKLEKPSEMSGSSLV
ncbi:MAG: 2,3-bisphosphoglycerate-independent phosphoglycerate mutase [Clostridiales bacterium]|nr:2,3-bisphosphoglycerate-independent phosphoglycerate mutase [Clostridiales bacterium]